MSGKMPRWSKGDFGRANRFASWLGWKGGEKGGMVIIMKNGIRKLLTET